MVEANLIRYGICDAAIVASVNLCIHPFANHQFYRLGNVKNNIMFKDVVFEIVNTFAAIGAFRRFKIFVM